jgi:hypothetical protein
MDPNEALKNAREAAARILTMSNAERPEGEDANDLAEAFEALDGWLTGGGFPPDAWKPRVREQTTEEG